MKKKSKELVKKKETSKENKKSELEKEVEEPKTIKEVKENKKIVKIEDEEFEDFFEEPEFNLGSPSLRRINSSPEIAINLERGLAEVAPLEKTEEESPFSYSSGVGNKDEPKYQNYSPNPVLEMINRSEIENIGKTNLFEKREIGLMRSSESGIGETKNFERYDSVKRVDINELGKETERREIKYKALK